LYADLPGVHVKRSRGFVAAIRNRAGSGQHRWDWRLTLGSSLLYAIAFNLTFFLQELFLVIPKSLTPGLYPTLFHNNHTWTGNNPLQDLLQGTGALATLLAGVFFMYLLPRYAARSPTTKLFIFWMAFQGLFQSLLQVVIGAINPLNDVGKAMNYLRLGRGAKTAAALMALSAMIYAGTWLTSHLLGFAKTAAQVDTLAKRASLVFSTATLPGFTAIVFIIPFRVPRNMVEVVLVPIIVTAAGMISLQCGALR
jgi:hypothetical protein